MLETLWAMRVPGLALAGFLCLAGTALAQTDQTDLDHPASHVRAPDKVLLNAITTAGSRLVAVGEHGVISYSDDEGKSWRQASVPVDVLLNAVTFADPLEGWAAGHFGVVLHTSDGGETWQKQLDGNQVNRLALQAAQEATLQNSGLPTAPLAMRRAAMFSGIGPNKPFLAIDARNRSDILVIGAYRLADRSTDGGKTWQDMSLYFADRLSHNLYDIAELGPATYVAAETGLVFRSTDGGVTFSQVTAPTTATLFGVLGTGDGGILVYGVAGTAFISHDDGNSWHAIQAGDVNITGGVAMKSGAVLLANEAGALYISWDNGVTFKVFPKIIPMAVSGLAETPDGAVAIVGSGGVMVLPATEFRKAS
jgi:photosystem II stability/assembly factor-like uncharacterized protein